MENLKLLSDAELRARLLKLAREEREHLVAFLRHLAEWDSRDASERASFPSLYKYCIVELKYSEDAAHYRIAAARSGIRFPEIFEMLQDGRLTLTAVAILYPHINKDNAAKLLEKAQGLNSYELRRMIAGGAQSNGIPDRVKPLGGGMISVEFCAPEEFRDLIDRAKEVLWSTYPTGRMADILTHMTRDYLKRKDRDLKPPPGTAKGYAIPKSRYVPFWVQRLVWKRDHGSCVFSSGERVCGARAGLEFDHIKPVALGGRSDPENVRLLCRAHNQLRAREVFEDAARRHMRH